MDNHRKLYPVEMMAKALHVSVRSYYDYRSGKYTKRETKKEYYMANIQKEYITARGIYGSPRLSMELKKKNIPLSRSTTAKYMSELGLKSKLSRKFKRTTDSDHNLTVSPNLLNREFTPLAASLAWVSDITYIHTLNGFIYLTTVIDLFDRKVIGWSISDNMTTQETVYKAFKMAKHNRAITKGMIFHSDRGSQYASCDFVKLLKTNNLTQSMSRKGNCWDNAVAESFFKSLKCEMIYGNKLISAYEMEIQIFEYIEIWYNKARRHSAIGNLNIDEFWENIKQINYKSCVA